jgi:hypothetical protein
VKFRAPKGFDLTQARLLLQNYKRTYADRLRPYETRVYIWKK